jgi:hypothetical protein
MPRTIGHAFIAAALLALTGCPAPEHPKDPGGPPVEKKSGSAAREKVGITVYNQSFGLVREIRNVELAVGRVHLEFADVSGKIQPETVALKALGDPNALAVLEQNYRYDLLTPAKLLEKYVGKKVKVIRYNEKLGKDEIQDAEVLSVEGGVTLKIGDEITSGFPGRIAFPEVPANLIAKPTLMWLLSSRAPRQKVEVSYLTQGLNWRADYVLVVDKEDKKGDLHGWVTLTNDTGTSYRDAELKLVAGDVQRLHPPPVLRYDYADSSVPKAPPIPPQFREEGLFEYHLYTLERPTNLLDKEQKQVTLVERHDVGVAKKLIFFGAEHYFRSRYGEVQQNQKVGVYLDLENSEKNGLGLPLPKGIVRVYKADGSGARQFIGEDRIDHTPKDEKIRVKMGEAFDVVGDRKQMRWEPIGVCSSESSYEIELRNHKKTAETVEVVEPVGGSWTIVESSAPAKLKDSRTFTFEVSVPANGKTNISYTVRVKWC